MVLSLLVPLLTGKELIHLTGVIAVKLSCGLHWGIPAMRNHVRGRWRYWKAGYKTGLNLKYPLPNTPAQWLKEIRLAIADASEAMPFGEVLGEPISDANLFHLAPVVCLKFRGLKRTGSEAKRVTKVALANYVVNSDPDGIDHGLEHRPLMAFTLCYVAAHLALDLLDEAKAETILNYCEKHLEVGD